MSRRGKAVASNPDNPIIHDHLGDVYRKQGKNTQAIKQWKRALEFKPENAVSIETKIHQLQSMEK